MSNDDNVLPPVVAEADLPMGPDGEMPNMENFKMPSREELLAALDSMGLGEQEKEELRAALMGNGPNLPVASSWTSQGLILLVFLALVVSIFAFFGYKLYKSLKDKELKREEKRKLKQMKKRK